MSAENKKLKAADLRFIADRKLAAEGIPERARDLLTERGLAQAPCARAFIEGTAPAPTAAELVSELWATQPGQDLRAILDDKAAEEAAPSDDDAELDRIRAIPNLAARIAAARKAGLA